MKTKKLWCFFLGYTNPHALVSACSAPSSAHAEVRDVAAAHVTFAGDVELARVPEGGGKGKKQKKSSREGKAETEEKKEKKEKEEKKRTGVHSWLGVPQEKKQEKSSRERKEGKKERKKKTRTDAHYWLGVQINMQLPANTYATMALRELMRPPAGI
jgi:hypothetical protein